MDFIYQKTWKHNSNNCLIAHLDNSLIKSLLKQFLIIKNANIIHQIINNK